MLQVRAQQPRQTSSAKPQAAHKLLPPPVQGLVTNVAFLAAPEDAALCLENWIPFRESVNVRKGIPRYATLDSGAEVESMFEYKSATQNKFFAGAGTDIYDISAPGTPTTPLTPLVTGQTGGEYSNVNMATAGGNFMLLFNGLDDPLIWDGSTMDPAAITGPTPVSSLIQGWVYRNRVFMIEKDSLSAWYLDTNAIAGAAVEFPLTGIFKRGGSLLFGDTWSLDAGDGIDDKCVFVSDRGEVAIYEGADPAVLTDWRLVGRYDIQKPLGKNATTHAGGDLVIMTTDGMVPISEAIRREKTVLSEYALSRAIEPDWRFEVAGRSGQPWTIAEIENEGFAVVSLPYVTGLSDGCFVVNLQTNAWSRFNGISVNCVGSFNGDGYCGTEDGKIMRFQVGGQDDIDSPFVAKLSYHFSQFDAPGQTKVTTMARAAFTFSQDFNAQISISKNYEVLFPLPPGPLPVETAGALWDVAVWDQDVWGGSPRTSASQRWQVVRGTGFSISPQIQITSDDAGALDAKLHSLEFTYRLGNVVN